VSDQTLVNETPEKERFKERVIDIVGMRLDALTRSEALETVARWGRSGRGRTVCLANVHMAVETSRSDLFRSAVNAADLVLADGRPLVWAARLAGIAAEQSRGTDFMLALCQLAQVRGFSIGLLGGREAVLTRLTERLRERFPTLKIAYAYSPPFRSLSAEEDAAIIAGIRAAAPDFLFVGLGCPRQELWMAGHRARIGSVMLGVGAAFDFIAGEIRQAPRWMQRGGLEWFYRLIREPRRLIGRYASTNSRFLLLLALRFRGRRSR